MANTTVEERLGIKPEWVAESYEKTQNMMVTATAMKISVATVHRMLKRMRVPVDKHKVKGRSQIGKKYGCLYKWLQSHPGAKLPAKVKDICKLTGCSKNAVQGFFTRRKKQMEHKVENLPDLRRISGTLQLEDGRYISLASIASYKVVVDPYLYSVTLEIKTRTGEDVEAVLSLDGINKKLEENTWKARV